MTSLKYLAGCAVAACGIQAYDMAGVPGVVGAAIAGAALFMLLRRQFHASN